MPFSSLDPIIAHIRKVIEADEKKLAADREALAGLERSRALEQESIALSLDLPNEPSGQTDEFRNCQHITVAIALFLREKPNGATKEEIQEALKRRGWEFGKYPKRDVATGIGCKPDLFADEGGVISLKHPKHSNLSTGSHSPDSRLASARALFSTQDLSQHTNEAQPESKQHG